MIRVLYIAGFVALGCASPVSVEARQFSMSLHASPEQRSWIDQGAEAIDSVGAQTGVRFFEAEGLFKKRGEIMVFVLNVSEAPFNFAPESVTAMLEDGTPVPIITYEQLAREEAKQRKRRAFAAALGAMGNSMSAAGAGYTYGSGSATAYGPGGTANAYGTYSGYDATAAAIAQQNAQRQNQQLIANKGLQDVEGQAQLATAYQISTVEPGKSKGGSITFELPKKAQSSREAVTIIFTVTAGPETHQITAVMTPVR